MNHKWMAFRIAAAAVISAVAASQLAAQPPDILRKYRFIPSQTTVHVSGGSPGYNLDLTIAGRFGLVTGYDYGVDPTAHVPTLVPFADFVDVHGILYNPLSLAPVPLPGWDLDATLNLTGLHGTFAAGDPNQLYFLGTDGQGVAIRLQAVLDGGWLHLTGGSSDPPSNKSVLYQIDALAHLTPFPDFNFDGALTSADIPAMLNALADVKGFETQHGLSNDDFLSMGDLDGSGAVTNQDIQPLLNMMASESGGFVDAVPEPATLVLFAAALLLIAAACGGRAGLRVCRFN